MSLGSALRVFVSELASVGLDPAAVCHGFANPGAFCKAFRRWSGERPSPVRARRSGDVSARKGAAGAPPAMSLRHWCWLALIVCLAAALRLWCFIGYGRGDDPIYSVIPKQLLDLGWGFLTPSPFRFGVYYRLGLYLPIAASYALLGVNDLAYVLYPLLASLGSVVLVGLLGAALWNAEVGLLAALLMAVAPFDVAFASTMVIDIVTSFLTALAVYCVVAGERPGARLPVAWYVAAAAALWVEYWVKESALLLVPSFLAVLGFQLASGVAPRGPLAFCLALALLAASCVGFDWVLTGVPLNRFHVQMQQSGVATGPIAETLLAYPRWLLTGAPSEGPPLGYLFHLLLPALVYVALRERRRAAVVLLWLVPLALLLEFMPVRLEPLVLSPRYPRYLNALVAPAALIVAAALAALGRRSRLLVAGILLGLATTGILEARHHYREWTEGTIDARQASRLLWSLPPNRIFTDDWLCDRYRFDGGLELARLRGRECQYLWHGRKLTDLVAQGALDLRSLPAGYLVAGGSRVHYALMSSVLNLDDRMIPQTWRVVGEVGGPLTPYRLQPLRIWEIPRPAGQPSSPR